MQVMSVLTKFNWKRGRAGADALRTMLAKARDNTVKSYYLIVLSTCQWPLRDKRQNDEIPAQVAKLRWILEDGRRVKVVRPSTTWSYTGERVAKLEGKLKAKFVKLKWFDGLAEETAELWLKYNDLSKDAENLRIEIKYVAALGEALRARNQKTLATIADRREIKERETTMES